MRENGLPQVLTWRWAPCAAFVLGSVSFAAFMLLAIPDHIGQVPTEATSDSLRFQLARSQATPAPQSDWSGDTTNTVSATPRLAERTATRNSNSDVSSFPKRGFSPPLERPEPPPTPAPVAPPPMPPQPQLNVPPPAPPPPPAEQSAVAPPPQPQADVMPQAQAVPPPPDAQAAQAPAPN
jgi:hypothetical protein